MTKIWGILESLLVSLYLTIRKKSISAYKPAEYYPKFLKPALSAHLKQQGLNLTDNSFAIKITSSR